MVRMSLEMMFQIWHTSHGLWNVRQDGRAVTHEHIVHLWIVGVIFRRESSLLIITVVGRLSLVCLKHRFLKNANTCPYHISDVNASAFLQKVSNKLIVTLLNSQVEGSATAL